MLKPADHILRIMDPGQHARLTLLCMYVHTQRTTTLLVRRTYISIVSTMKRLKGLMSTGLGYFSLKIPERNEILNCTVRLHLDRIPINVV
jgi:hypothetical protein